LVLEVYKLSNDVRQMLKEGKVKIVGVLYDVEAGTVITLDPDKLQNQPESHIITLQNFSRSLLK